MNNNITVKELSKLIGRISLIDVRSVEKYNTSHINGSTNILANDLILQPSKYLNRYDKYYIYCQQGRTSNKVCTYLHHQGYNVVNVLGGYEMWMLEVDNFLS